MVWGISGLSIPTVEASPSYARSAFLRKEIIAGAEATPVCNAYIDVDMDGYHNKRNTQKRHRSTVYDLVVGAVVDVPMLRWLKFGRDGSRFSLGSAVPSFKGVGGGHSPAKGTPFGTLPPAFSL